MMAESVNVTTDMNSSWVGDVLHFWFEELTQNDWFAKSTDIDQRIRDRFASLHEHLAAHEGVNVTVPRPVLAAVIVLDQFSRNLYRNDLRAFSADAAARRLSKSAIAQGFDMAVKTEERYFLYLPFEHSEDRADQVLAVDLIERLGNDEWTGYAVAHKIIIDRFGRFPHRNAALNRRSTADEIAFLKEPARPF
jgi:uncharacterized protein (DUF924 family)